MPRFQCFNVMSVWCPIEYSPRDDFGLMLMIGACLEAGSVNEAFSLGLIRTRNPGLRELFREFLGRLLGQGQLDRAETQRFMARLTVSHSTVRDVICDAMRQEVARLRSRSSGDANQENA